MSVTGAGVIDPTRQVNEVIRTHPETIAVFNRFGIDTCCGGAVSIQIAAARDGADLDELMAALSGAVQGAR
jgi:iron-sulfur cluster repair protein YtfE (RIC family)